MLNKNKATWQHTIRLLKQADAKKPRVVYGVVYSPCQKGGTCETDSQGDWIKPETLRKAAWDFMEKSRIVGNQHKGTAKAVIVENQITPVDMVVDGEKIVKGSWVVGVKINDDALWKKVESGELSAFSIGGTGVRVEANPTAE
jgi:hypothetical protein